MKIFMPNREGLYPWIISHSDMWYLTSRGEMHITYISSQEKAINEITELGMFSVDNMVEL